MTLTQRLAELTAELIRRNPRVGDVEAHGIELSRYRLVIHLRPRPAVLIDPQPGPGRPYTRQERRA